VTDEERFAARAAMIANIFLAGGGVVSVLTLFYCLYQYRWSGHRLFASSMGTAAYIGLPALAGGLFLAALSLKPAQKLRVVLVALAVTASMYSVELFLEMTYSAPPIGSGGLPVMNVLEVSAQKQREQMAAQLTRTFGVAIDTRTRLQVISDLAKSGIDAVPSVIPRYQLRYHHDDDGTGGPVIALGGISSKATVLCNESGQHVIYDSDEHGFHNPKGLWHTGAIDIAAVGDSFTQGYCVPSERNFVALIRQRHPETVNLGMAGEGPLLMLATIREYAQPLQPRIVLWFYFEGNDLLDLTDEMQSRLLMRYVAADDFTQGLLQRQAEIDRALRGLVAREQVAAEEEQKVREADVNPSVVRTAGEKLIAFSKLYGLRSRLGLVRSATSREAAVSSVLDSHVDLFGQILTRARTDVSSWGGALYFVYLPNWTRYDAAREFVQEHRAAEKQRVKVLRVVKGLGIPLIDVVPAFDAQRDPMSLFPFRAPGHYTEEGHHLVAEEVLRVVDGQ
jgi:hypothetical protein